MEARLFKLQRGSALILAVLVPLHLGLLVYAVDQGITAEAILGRTRGSLFWGASYALFVMAVALHAPIGLRSILRESFGWRGRGLEVAMLLVGLLLAALGLRAVAAVVL